jgi:hypothetical protein
MFNKNYKKGYTALFAVLVSSLVLAVGVGIINITLKEITLSGAGRESQLAFYAADTGAECAMYWDLKGIDVFATSTSINQPNPSNPTCVGVDFFSAIDGTLVYDRQDTSASTQFRISCADITVTKSDLQGSDGVSDSTVIDARGYNTCDTGNTRRLERGLQISY